MDSLSTKWTSARLLRADQWRENLVRFYFDLNEAIRRATTGFIFEGLEDEPL